MYNHIVMNIYPYSICACTCTCARWGVGCPCPSGCTCTMLKKGQIKIIERKKKKTAEKCKSRYYSYNHGDRLSNF